MSPSASSGLFDDMLIHRADVYRRRTEDAPDDQIPTEVDRFGQQQKLDRLGQPTQDEQFSHSLPCRFSRPSGKEQFAERTRDVVQEAGSLFLDRGADLREDDVVTVIDAAGQELVSLAQVTYVGYVQDGVGEHHRNARLEKQRQSR